MDTVYGTKKYFQSLSGASDIYRSPACRAVSNDYTYQNTLGRRSTLGAYYHMNNQPSYSNDLSLNNQYGYNTWGIWRDGRNFAPSTFSAKANCHYQKTRSFSIILTTAAFIVLLAVISVAGLAFYFSSIKGHVEDPVLLFEGSFRIAKGDIFSTGLKHNHTSSYKQKVEFYKRFVERALTDQSLQPLRVDVWGFGEGPLIKVNFRIFFDVRKLPQNIHSVEEFIKESLFQETTAVKSLYRSLRIDADSMEIKRILEEHAVKSASLFKDSNTVPTSQTQLEKRLMKKPGFTPALISKPASVTKARTTSKAHSADEEPDVDVENAPVIQGSFEGSFEITKTDADIALKKTTPTRAHTMVTLPPKAVTPYTLRVKPKRPGIEKLTTIVPQHNTVASSKAATTTTVITTTTTTTTTATTPTATTTKKPSTAPSSTTTTTTTAKSTTKSEPITTMIPNTAADTSSSIMTSISPLFSTSLPLSVSSTSMPVVSLQNHQNYPDIGSSLSLPKLDQNLFTSVPVLDTQPWRPIHREVPEFLAGPPPAYPTKTLPTLQMPAMPTSHPLLPPPGPVMNEEPPRRRIDEIELPFLPEEPRPPFPIFDSLSNGKPNFYGPAFRKPDSAEIKNSQELIFYHSFGNPVFMPASESIERLGAGASVQPHPLPVPLIDEVVIPPFKPLNPNTKEEIPFDLDSNNAKFEHLGDGVIAKKMETTTRQADMKSTTLTSINKPEDSDSTTEFYQEILTTVEPKSDVIPISSTTSQLADKIGEFFMDLLDLQKSNELRKKNQPLESRIEPEDEQRILNSTSREEIKETNQNENTKDTTLRFVADDSQESTSDEVSIPVTTTVTSTRTTEAEGAKPNFLNIKELILKRNELGNENLKKSTSDENLSRSKTTTIATITSTSTAASPTDTPGTSPKTTTERLYTTTTNRYRIKPAQHKPPTILDDSNLFPSHSKWEFVNNSAASLAGHTANMRKVFNTTLQAWVSEDIEKTENFTLNDLKSKINNATNIQDISLIFDTLASRLGITPSVPTKVPPFSHNKLKHTQTQNNEKRVQVSTTTRTTTRVDTSTVKAAQSTPTPLTEHFIYEEREPMPVFAEETSIEGVGAAIPVVGEAEVEVIDPTKYEEMLRSSQFADASTTETVPKLVTLLPVRSNSGIRHHKPLGDSARGNSEISPTSIASSLTGNTSPQKESTKQNTPAVSPSIKSSATSTPSRKKSNNKSSNSQHRPAITRRKHVSQSRRFPPPEAIIRGGLKVTVK